MPEEQLKPTLMKRRAMAYYPDAVPPIIIIDAPAHEVPREPFREFGKVVDGFHMRFTLEPYLAYSIESLLAWINYNYEVVLLSTVGFDIARFQAHVDRYRKADEEGKSKDESGPTS